MSIHIDKNKPTLYVTMGLPASGNYCILWIKTPYEIVKERIQTRDHEVPVERMVHPPLELLDRMSKAFEDPTQDESAITIDGTLPYDEQRVQLLEND